MAKYSFFDLLFFYFLLGFLSMACQRPARTDRLVYHSIEKYLHNEGNQNTLNRGKKVLFVINANGCFSCLQMIKNFAQTAESPDIKFIYSIEHPRLVDRETVELSKKKPAMVKIDYENTPFREGVVLDSPVVYFLTDGLMTDSVALTPRIFDATILKINQYLLR